MKRGPNAGEVSLDHITTNTGDAITLAVCDENFAPAVLEQMRPMLDGAVIGGYKLVGIRRPARASAVHFLEFQIAREDGTALSVNSVRRIGRRVQLVSCLFPHKFESPAEAMLIADLEQCAALVLLDTKVL